MLSTFNNKKNPPDVQRQETVSARMVAAHGSHT